MPNVYLLVVPIFDKAPLLEKFPNSSAYQRLSNILILSLRRVGVLIWKKEKYVRTKNRSWTRIGKDIFCAYFSRFLANVQTARRNFSQFWSFKIRRTTFLNYIRLANLLIVRLWNFEKVLRVVSILLFYASTWPTRPNFSQFYSLQI